MCSVHFMTSRADAEKHMDASWSAHPIASSEEKYTESSFINGDCDIPIVAHPKKDAMTHGQRARGRSALSNTASPMDTTMGDKLLTVSMEINQKWAAVIMR